VAGEATGKLVEVDHIEAKDLEGSQEAVILLVKRASGDEEVGASGTNLKGVILCHGLPHLSHLGDSLFDSWHTIFHSHTVHLIHSKPPKGGHPLPRPPPLLSHSVARIAVHQFCI